LLSARPDLLRPRDTAETNFHVQSSSLYGWIWDELTVTHN
jgi:hypothetical protein